MRVAKRRAGRDEAEKPFWISYADLMTALMVLFLVVMSVALLAVTKTVSDAEKAKAAREAAIETCLDELEAAARSFPGVTVDRASRAVNFGDRARFQYNSASLAEPQKQELRQFVPRVLSLAKKQCGAKWLRRVVVEGFTDQTGSYLYNLDLSLRRSQSVLCALFDDDSSLSLDQREQIRSLFLIGGYSSNSAMPTPEESRRIEFRLEFYGLDEAKPPVTRIENDNFGKCSG